MLVLQAVHTLSLMPTSQRTAVIAAAYGFLERTSVSHTPVDARQRGATALSAFTLPPAAASHVQNGALSRSAACSTACVPPPAEIV